MNSRRGRAFAPARSGPASFGLLLLLAAAFAAGAEEEAGTAWLVDISPCMDIAAPDERAACYDSLARVVERLRAGWVRQPPVPPEPAAPPAPPSPPDPGFPGGERALRVMRIEEGKEAAPVYRLREDMGVWVRPGGPEVFIILEGR